MKKQTMVLFIALFTLVSSILCASPPKSPYPQGADKEMNKQVASYYDAWKKNYLRESKTVAGAYYVDYKKNQTTCSEAHGYGMLIVVSMAGYDKDAKKIFDGLNTFRKHYSSSINPDLMCWYVDDKIKHKPDDCATDGDLDNSYALLLASKQWGGNYRAEAKVIIKAMEKSLVRKDFSLRRGEWDIYQHCTRLSDIMPGHFHAFSKVGNSSLWKKVLDQQYKILDATTSAQGVFPDFVYLKGKKWQAVPPKYLESKHDGEMYCNSCRVPWRLATAFVHYKHPQAKKLLDKYNGGIGIVKNSDFKGGYKLNGEALNSWTDGAFTAPHLCNLYAQKREEDFKQAFRSQLMKQEGYYSDSIRVLCLLLVSENFQTP